MRRLVVLMAVAAGYVLGARAGRERYEQIVDAANRFWGNPTVRKTASTVGETVKEQAPVAKDKMAGAASSVMDKVHSSGDSSGDGQVHLPDNPQNPS